MKKIILFTFLTLIFIAANAQVSQGVWTIGGTSNDYGYAIAQTPDGGYAIGGYTNSYGAGFEDFYIAKMDSDGNLLWTKTIGGTDYDYAYSMVTTYDKGFVLTGVVDSYGDGMDDVYVVKLDSLGNLEWTKTIGGISADQGQRIRQTTDSGYIIAGWTRSWGTEQFAYVIRLNSAGDLKWTKAYFMNSSTSGRDIIQTRDGGFAVTGTGYYSGTSVYSIFLIKLDTAGNIQWMVPEIGGSVDNYSGSIVQSRIDGSYLIAGSTESYGAGSGDVYLVKFDTLGNLIWSKTIGGTNNDGATAMVQTRDGGYALTGITASYSQGGYDVYLIKIDSTGGIQWTRAMGGASDDEGESIVQTRDGGYAIGGYTNSFGAGGYDALIIKVDSMGNSCLPTINDSGRISSGSAIGSGGGLIYSDSGRESSGGIVNSGGTIYNVCSVLTSAKNCNVITNILSIYPNPCSGTLYLDIKNMTNYSIYSIQIADVTGRIIINEDFPSVNSGYPISVASLSSGIYFIRINSSSGTEVKKFIKE